MELEIKGVIGYDDVLRGLNEAVKANGYDYKYPRTERGACYNVFDGKPDCIVGWVMIWLGVPIEWFDTDGRDNADVGEVCKALFLVNDIKFSDEARDLLGWAQTYQDNGSTWGVSVTRAHLGDRWFHSLNLHQDAA
jgi:hypothetical protein